MILFADQLTVESSSIVSVQEIATFIIQTSEKLSCMHNLEILSASVYSFVYFNDQNVPRNAHAWIKDIGLFRMQRQNKN